MGDGGAWAGTDDRRWIVNHTETRADLEIAFVRSGDTVHICAGWRPYCGGVDAVAEALRDMARSRGAN